VTNRPPARIDREALERILQRAAELQAIEGDPGDELSTQEVLELGKEVGIPTMYLQRAMVEEQSRLQLSLAGASGLVDRAVGPAEISALRVVNAEPDVIERELLAWMEKNELLVVQRHQPGRITWERMRGMQAALRRGISGLQSGPVRFMLMRADTVRATITPLETGYSHVSLSATLGSARSSYIGGALAVGSIGLAGGAVLFALGLGLIALAPLPAAFGAGWGITRLFPPIARRVQLGLERALDHIEAVAQRAGQGKALPPKTTGLLEVLAGEVRKAIAASSSRPSPQPPRSSSSRRQ
jgi:hypothetical protein